MKIKERSIFTFCNYKKEIAACFPFIDAMEININSPITALPFTVKFRFPCLVQFPERFMQRDRMSHYCPLIYFSTLTRQTFCSLAYAINY